MRNGIKGQVVFDGTSTIHPVKLDDLCAVLGTESAADTATLVPIFGPSVVGEVAFAERLGIDFGKALLGGLSYQWHRPFRAAEVVSLQVRIEDFYERDGLQFAVAVSEFRDDAGELIQAQSATFIERSDA